MNRPISMKQIRAQLAKRMKAMERERDALRELESNVAEQADRMGDACDSIEYAIQRLSEVV